MINAKPVEIFLAIKHPDVKEESQVLSVATDLHMQTTGREETLEENAATDPSIRTTAERKNLFVEKKPSVRSGKEKEMQPPNRKFYPKS